MSTPLRWALATVASAITAAPAAAQTALPRDLDAEVTRALRLFQVPGMAIAVVKDGTVLLARGYGVRRLGEATPVDANTYFQIASNTKAFTTALLAQLVDSGKLAWDDPVPVIGRAMWTVRRRQPDKAARGVDRVVVRTQ